MVKVSHTERRGSSHRLPSACFVIGCWNKAGLSELQAAIAAPLPAAVSIGDPDPQVTGALRLAAWAGLRVTAVDIDNLRLALMSVLRTSPGW